MNNENNNTEEVIDENIDNNVEETQEEPTVEDQIEELEVQVAEAKDKYIRLFAEFENFKKRNIKERMALIGSASEGVISVLLPVLDDFDRAKKSAEDENTEEVFTEGVTLVYQKLNKVLEGKGLKKMESTGETFDPEVHEAITKIPAPSEDMKGKNIDTIEAGYMLNDKIIRFAKVVVGE